MLQKRVWRFKNAPDLTGNHTRGNPDEGSCDLSQYESNKAQISISPVMGCDLGPAGSEGETAPARSLRPRELSLAQRATPGFLVMMCLIFVSAVRGL